VNKQWPANQRQEQLHIIEDPELVKQGSTPIYLKTISELLNYIQPLLDFKKDHYRLGVQDNKALEAPHGSSLLMTAHKNKSSLFIDKYISCTIPDPQLEFLLESIGIMEYNADLVRDREFKYTVCEDKEGVISELFTPNISGDRWNPYIRFKSSSVCGTQQCSKLLNLAGIDLKQWIDRDMLLLDHDVVLNELVLTYPQEVSLLLLDPGKREDVIGRSKRCVKRFFKGLHGLFDLPEGHVLGCSETTHTWDSHMPFLPHLHHHVIFPHISYLKISKEDRLSIDENLEDLYKQISELISPDSETVDSIRYDSIVEDKRVVDSDISGCKVVTDQDKYKILKRELSERLSEYLDFKPLLWKGRYTKIDEKGISREIELPLDATALKELWTRIVKEEFAEVLKKFDKQIDLHVQWFKTSSKAKLLHALQYKTRPPVLDLDLFFRRCEDFIVDYNKINKETVLNYVRGLFVKAVMKEKVQDSTRYESLLKKTEFIFKNYSEDHILGWMRFISICPSKTTVLGFWRNIKRYLLDPLDHKVLVDDGVCLVCGGFSVDVRYVSSFCIDSVIMRSSSKFLIYNVKDPPPGGGIV